MANKEIGEWNPMAEAHQNPIFNSYVEGPGANLSMNQQPSNWGSGSGSSRKRTKSSSGGNRACDNENKLHITNVPVSMTIQGLRGFLMRFAKPKSVFIPDGRKIGSSTTWAIAEFDTYGDAEAAMRGCNDKPPYNLQIRFSKKINEERKNSEQPANFSMPSPFIDPKPSFDEVPPKSDINRKEALQHILLKENCLDKDTTDVPNLQQGIEGFFQLPSGGEFVGPNAKIMSSEHRLDIEAGGWKMGVNRKYFPPSLSMGNTTKRVNNSNPPERSPYEIKAADLTNKVTDGQCSLCRTKCTGLCGACRKIPYCSQACATADFKRHMVDCYIPVPAVFFDVSFCNKTDSLTPQQTHLAVIRSPLAAALQNPVAAVPSPVVAIQKPVAAVPSPVAAVPSLLTTIESPSMSSASQKSATTDISKSLQKGKTPSPKTSEVTGGDHGNRHNGSFSLKEEGCHGRQLLNQPNSFSNNSTSGGNRTPGRKSFGNSVQTNGLLPSPVYDLAALAHNSSFSILPDIDKKFNDKKKKVWISNEELENDVIMEVEVTFHNNFGLYVVKSANKLATKKLNEDLKCSWPRLRQLDRNNETFCAFHYNEAVYRGKILQTGTESPTKLRMKLIDYGKITYVNINEVRGLPESAFEYPAQSIQVRFKEALPDMYTSIPVGHILRMKIIEKIDNAAWLVEVCEKGETGGSCETSQNGGVKSTSNNLKQSFPLLSKEITSPIGKNLFEDNDKSSVTPEPCMDIPLIDTPPLNTYTVVTITEINSDQVFWGNLLCKQGDLTDIESKLIKYLNGKPQSYTPVLNEYVAVLHEECWYRAKVLKLSPNVRVGLIDYGLQIASALDKISSLPEEIRILPRQALKFKASGHLSMQLAEEMKVKVKPVYAGMSPDGCCHVEVVCTSDVSSLKEKKGMHTTDNYKVPGAKPCAASQAKPCTAPQAAGISLVQQELPADRYSEVTITEIYGQSRWVNLVENTSVIVEIFTKFDTCDSEISSSCNPTIGEIVAAKYEGLWYRAKVVAVSPKLRVFYIDFGNESEVTADQIKELHKDLTNIPAQAIKIRFSSTTSTKYSELELDSTLSIKPVSGAQKAADGSIIVTVKGDVQEHTVTQGKADAPEKSLTLEKLVASAQAPDVAENYWAPFRWVDIPLNEYFEFTITLPGEPCYVNLVKEQKPLNDMMHNLNMSLDLETQLCIPTVGMAVATCFDEIWHRAKVLAVEPNLQVFLSDYGNICRDIQPNGIGALSESYMDFPAQAIRIIFVDGIPMQYYSDEEVVFTAKVIKKLPDGTCVLQPKNAAEGTLSHQEIKKSMPQVEKSAVTTPTKCSATVSASGPPVNLPCSEVEILSEEKETQVVVALNLGNEIWVNIMSKAPSLTKLMNELNKKADALQPCTPKTDDFVAMLFKPLSCWHRGKVLSVSKGVYEVLLIDYGVVDKVTIDVLRALPDKFLTLPAQGIRVQFTLGSPDKCKNATTDTAIFIRQLTKVEKNLSVVVGIDK